MFKRILRSAWVFNTLAYILAGYMALVKRTTRWTVIGHEHLDPILDSGDGVIMTVWHGRLLICNSAWPRKKQPAAVLVSQSNDGDFISKAGQFLGLIVIRGSTRREGSDKERGGAAALKQMIRHIRAKGCMVMTPDGPRGPRMRTGKGPISLAKMTGAKILPCALATKNRVLFKSWDRFMLPIPFGRGTIVYGEPIVVDRKADETQVEAARALLESRMNAGNIAADESIGKEIIQPADTAKKARLS